jgi:hypothetical protein
LGISKAVKVIARVSEFIAQQSRGVRRAGAIMASRYDVLKKGCDFIAAADARATRAIQALSEAFVRVYNAGDLDGLADAAAVSACI